MNFKLHTDLKRDGIMLGRFPLCLVILINDSAYPWFVLVPERKDIRDTIDLTPVDYQSLWNESHALSVGIMSAFAGEKLNVAALGNVTPQLHIHHVVRFSKDLAWPGPIWGKQPLTPYNDDRVQEICELLAKVKMPGYAPAN